MTDRTAFQMNLGGAGWDLPEAATTFAWDYTDGRDHLLALYDKGKQKQWNSTTRIDWSHVVDRNNPMAVPDISDSVLGPERWAKLNDDEKGQMRLHSMAWQFSQFLHGEQGALLCAAKLVHAVPQMDAKMYAATQVVDEARHVEVYSRYLDEKLGTSYPVNKHLKVLLGQVITDNRWDITSLGMQIIVEGLALASLHFVREFAREPLVRSIVTYVMQDEARHVAFGRMALRDLYPQLSESERKQREEFVVEACYLMRDRFIPTDVWERMGLDVAECTERTNRAPETKQFRSLLFMRLAPIIRDIGLLGPTVKKAFEDMGVMQFTQLDIDSQSRRDEEAGDVLDQQRMAAIAADQAATIEAGEDGVTSGVPTGLNDDLAGGFMEMPAWTAPAYARPDAFVERKVVVGAAPFALPGMLTVPREPGRYPGVVLIHASSRHDGDETIGGVKFFKDLAWGLASLGVAVLRYEKRTHRYPTITEQPGFTVREGVIDDVISAVGVLAAQPEVDPARISLIGHGVGGMLAPRIAVELEGKIAAIAILAANSRPVEVVTQGQLDYLEQMVARQPAPAAEETRTDAVGRQLHSTGAQLVILRKLLERMRAPDLRDDELLFAGDMKVAGSYFTDLRGYDPLAVARSVTVPILLGHPENDYQITMVDYAGWRDGLAGRPRTDIRLYRGLNHMFVATTGPSTPEEYMRPDHVAPILIEEMAVFARGAGSQAGRAT